VIIGVRSIDFMKCIAMCSMPSVSCVARYESNSLVSHLPLPLVRLARFCAGINPTSEPHSQSTAVSNVTGIERGSCRAKYCAAP